MANPLLQIHRQVLSARPAGERIALLKTML
jgi:hypothetical protein